MCDNKGISMVHTNLPENVLTNLVFILQGPNDSSMLATIAVNLKKQRPNPTDFIESQFSPVFSFHLVY